MSLKSVWFYQFSFHSVFPYSYLMKNQSYLKCRLFSWVWIYSILSCCPWLPWFSKTLTLSQPKLVCYRASAYGCPGRTPPPRAWLGRTLSGMLKVAIKPQDLTKTLSTTAFILITSKWSPGLALACVRVERGATGDKLAIKTKSGKTQSPNLMCVTTAMVGRGGRC